MRLLLGAKVGAGFEVGKVWRVRSAGKGEWHEAAERDAELQAWTAFRILRSGDPLVPG